MTQPKEPLTYAGSGVDYDPLDAFKRAAQAAALETSNSMGVSSGGVFHELSMSRGESAFLVEAPWCYLAQVEEGLGTKNLVADAMYALTTDCWHFTRVAQCGVAMIVNDMVTLGALPLSVAMHLAVGTSDWFKDQARAEALIEGWKLACHLAGCTWGGGETPTLKGVVVPGTFVLSGSAMGVVMPKRRLIDPSRIQAGDAIVMIESSGIHANGLTLAREIAQGLPGGYLTCLSDGRTYGDHLLSPTIIYVGLVQDCLNIGVDIHSAINITGHGWRKLMRATEPFVYVVEALPSSPQPIFQFIQEQGPVTDEEAFGNLNMGAGFAFYVPERDVPKVIDAAGRAGLTAWRAGHIEASHDGLKQVVIKPKGLVYSGDTLGVR